MLVYPHQGQSGHLPQVLSDGHQHEHGQQERTLVSWRRCCQLKNVSDQPDQHRGTAAKTTWCLQHNQFLEPHVQSHTSEAGSAHSRVSCSSYTLHSRTPVFQSGCMACSCAEICNRSSTGTQRWNRQVRRTRCALPRFGEQAEHSAACLALICRCTEAGCGAIILDIPLVGQRPPER